MIKKLLAFDKTIFFFLSFVVFCSACNDNEKDNEGKKGEKYGPVPTDIEPVEAPPTPWRFHIENMPKEVLDRVKITVKYLNENKTETFGAEEGKFTMTREDDGSEYIKTSLYGVISSGNTWQKNFNLQLSAVVDSTNPPDYPYEWDYLLQHYEEPKNLAEQYAYNQTIMRIEISYNDKEPPYDWECIYPNPVAADPENVVLTGYTRLLDGTHISYDNSLRMISRSEIYEKDHAGMELEISYTLDLDRGV